MKQDLFSIGTGLICDTATHGRSNTPSDSRTEVLDMYAGVEKVFGYADAAVERFPVVSADALTSYLPAIATLINVENTPWKHEAENAALPDRTIDPACEIHKDAASGQAANHAITAISGECGGVFNTSAELLNEYEQRMKSEVEGRPMLLYATAPTKESKMRLTDSVNWRAQKKGEVIETHVGSVADWANEGAVGLQQTDAGKSPVSAAAMDERVGATDFFDQNHPFEVLVQKSSPQWERREFAGLREGFGIAGAATAAGPNAWPGLDTVFRGATDRKPLGGVDLHATTAALLPEDAQAMPDAYRNGRIAEATGTDPAGGERSLQQPRRGAALCADYPGVLYEDLHGSALYGGEAGRDHHLVQAIMSHAVDSDCTLPKLLDKSMSNLETGDYDESSSRNGSANVTASGPPQLDPSGAPGWLVALTGAVVRELSSGASENGLPAASNVLTSHAAGPSGTRDDPFYVTMAVQPGLYRTYMPTEPTGHMPVQSPPVPGQVAFSS